MDGIIHNVNRRSATIVPIFRSKHQMEILGHLFLRPERRLSISQIARETRVSQPTVSREVNRLGRAGILTSETVGRTRLVRPNLDSPYFVELQSLLLKTLGPAPLLSERLEKLSGVREAYIFGSWARRYSGEVGTPPADIDVAVIGDPPVDAVDQACRVVEKRIGIEVNPVVIAPREWSSGSSGFIRQVKKGALFRLLDGER